MGPNDNGSADVLLTTGAVLTLSTYIYGKIAAKKKEIMEFNQMAKEENLIAKKHNLSVDRKLRIEYRKRLKAWEKKNKDRGKVEVVVLQKK